MDNFVKQRLMELCKSAGLSQYQLARKAGISTSSLYSILKGTSSPRLSTLNDLCYSLNVTLAQFFVENAEERHRSDNIRRLETEFMELSEVNQRFILDFVEIMLRYQREAENRYSMSIFRDSVASKKEV